MPKTAKSVEDLYLKDLQCAKRNQRQWHTKDDFLNDGFLFRCALQFYGIIRVQIDSCLNIDTKNLFSLGKSYKVPAPDKVIEQINLLKKGTNTPNLRMGFFSFEFTTLDQLWHELEHHSYQTISVLPETIHLNYHSKYRPGQPLFNVIHDYPAELDEFIIGDTKHADVLYINSQDGWLVNDVLDKVLEACKSKTADVNTMCIDLTLDISLTEVLEELIRRLEKVQDIDPSIQWREEDENKSDADNLFENFKRLLKLEKKWLFLLQFKPKTFYHAENESDDVLHTAVCGESMHEAFLSFFDSLVTGHNRLDSFNAKLLIANAITDKSYTRHLELTVENICYTDDCPFLESDKHKLRSVEKPSVQKLYTLCAMFAMFGSNDVGGQLEQNTEINRYLIEQLTQEALILDSSPVIVETCIKKQTIFADKVVLIKSLKAIALTEDGLKYSSLTEIGKNLDFDIPSQTELNAIRCFAFNLWQEDEYVLHPVIRNVILSLPWQMGEEKTFMYKLHYHIGILAVKDMCQKAKLEDGVRRIDKAAQIVRFSHYTTRRAIQSIVHLTSCIHPDPAPEDKKYEQKPQNECIQTLQMLFESAHGDAQHLWRPDEYKAGAYALAYEIYTGMEDREKYKLQHGPCQLRFLVLTAFMNLDDATAHWLYPRAFFTALKPEQRFNLLQSTAVVCRLVGEKILLARILAMYDVLTQVDDHAIDNSGNQYLEKPPSKLIPRVEVTRVMELIDTGNLIGAQERCQYQLNIIERNTGLFKQAHLIKRKQKFLTLNCKILIQRGYFERAASEIYDLLMTFGNHKSREPVEIYNNLSRSFPIVISAIVYLNCLELKSKILVKVNQLINIPNIENILTLAISSSSRTVLVAHFCKSYIAYVENRLCKEQSWLRRLSHVLEVSKEPSNAQSSVYDLLIAVFEFRKLIRDVIKSKKQSLQEIDKILAELEMLIRKTAKLNHRLAQVDALLLKVILLDYCDKRNLLRRASLLKEIDGLIRQTDYHLRDQDMRKLKHHHHPLSLLCMYV